MKVIDLPEVVKTEIDRLIATNGEKSSCITFNILARNSATVNVVENGVLQPQQPQLQQDSQITQPQNENEEYDSDNYEMKIPSDLSIDHHPRRTSHYSLSFQGNSTHSEEDSTNDIKWIPNDHCISDLCFNVKSTTIQTINTVDPAQLSDIRLLVLNDIYVFDKNYASSVSKYLTTAVHSALKPLLLFETYYPERGIRCYDWCMGIEESLPHDWLSSLTLCAKMLNDACESKNILDI